MRISGAGRRTWELVQGQFRQRKTLAAGTVLVVGLGCLAGGGAYAAEDAIHPAVSTHGSTKLCGKDEHLVTISRVDIRNNNFRGEPMCLTVYYHKANFQITYSGLHEPWAAYPNAFVGCEISVCTPESPMPIQVRNIRQAYSSWHYHPGHAWVGNAAYDCWFNPKRMTTGQVNHGAEIMIWLNQSKVGRPSGTPVYIDGTWWDFTTWVANHGGRKWNYIRFWRQKPTLQVTNLNLKNFFGYAQKRRLLSSAWWLTAVESGYELWSGGVGMHTLSYSVQVTPWHAKPKPKPKPTKKPTPKPTPKPTATLSATPKPTAVSPATPRPTSIRPATH